MRRLALGHKQLEENPWDTFQTVFTPGSVHKATITEKSERGAVLELPYGIEGFAYPKSLVKEDGSNAENGFADGDGGLGRLTTSVSVMRGFPFGRTIG